MKKVLYINAGAGTGKTYKLTHLLSDCLSSKKIKPSEVIVTTFTKAAAAEIKERARKVLIENDLIDQATQLETAAIGTIDSVAQQFVNKYWYAVGMQPKPDVLSDADKAIYRKSSIAQILSSGNFEKERKAIQSFFDTFHPKHKANEYLVDNPDFWTEYLEDMVGKISYYGIDDKNLADSKQESINEVNTVFCSDASPLTDSEYNEYINESIVAFNKEIATKSTKTLTDGLDTIKSLPKTSNYLNTLSLYSKLCALNKDSLTAIAAAIQPSLQSKEYGVVICNCITALFTLAKAWNKEYDSFKKSHGVIDYDDMEQGFLQLLNIDSIAEEIAENYKLVMVDEFQDCNPLQLQIFDRLSDLVADKSPLAQSTVWVGDPKQAIYSFRGSNTDLIERIEKKFPSAINAVDGNGNKKETLDVSYRSRKPLIDLVNEVFDKDGLFKGMTHLKEHNPEHGKYTEAILHWNFKDTKNDDFRLNLARKIKETVESGQFWIVPKGESEARLLQYKDIAVLVKKNKDAQDIAQEMMCAEVPVAIVETNIIDRAEVQLLLALLHLSEWKNANNAHEWATVLHLWCGESTENILRERIDYLNNEGKSDEWLTSDERLKGIRVALDEVKDLSFDQKLKNLILLLGLNDRVGMWGERESRIQNMQTLQNAATAFVKRCERLGIEKNTTEFIAYLEESKLDVKKILDSDSVKIVTYHSSKGLEWPMVILASLNDSKFGDNDIKAKFFGVSEQQVDDDDTNSLIPTYQLRVFPDIIGQHAPSFIIDVIKSLPRFNKLRTNEKKDATRLLYVGMTRAREYLVSVTQNGKKSWLDGLDINWLDMPPIVKEEIDAIAVKEPKESDYKPKGLCKKKIENQTEEDRRSDREKIAEARAKFDEACRKYDDFLNNEKDRHQLPRKEYTLRNVADLCDNEHNPLVLSPSKIADDSLNASFEAYRLDGVHFFPNDIADNEYAAMGTCIHNIFAAYNPEANDNDVMASRVIHSHGFDGRILPENVINSITSLYSWLEKEYGAPAKIEHEVPFIHQRHDGSVVRGEMDLLWNTDKGTVLVDFKNFVAPAADAFLLKTREDGSDNPHYVGLYLPQIEAYSSALTENNEKPIARIIYYATMGEVVVFKP